MSSNEYNNFGKGRKLTNNHMNNETKTYTIEVYCRNCNHEFSKDIPKGQTSSGFITCPNCGCAEGKSQGTPQRSGITMKSL